jgi:hypothetical protein
LESGAHWSGVPLHEIYMDYDDITTDEITNIISNFDFIKNK